MNAPADSIARVHHAANVMEAAGMGTVTIADLRAAADDFADLIDAARTLADNLASIAKAGIRVPLSTRQAAAALRTTLAGVKGGAA